MGRLFSEDDTTILGTMPREIYVGFDQAADLVRTDWQSWGDCLFDLENVHISSSGEVAWIATVGFVRFDLSRFLVLPLRLSGVLVREDGIWRFQHLQFQFDLDLSYLLLITALLGIWLVDRAHHVGGDRSEPTPTQGHCVGHRGVNSDRRRSRGSTENDRSSTGIYGIWKEKPCRPHHRVLPRGRDETSLSPRPSSENPLKYPHRSCHVVISDTIGFSGGSRAW